MTDATEPTGTQTFTLIVIAISLLVLSAASAWMFYTQAVPAVHFSLGPFRGAVIMVKNEEKALPRLLDSLRGFADWIFICDTGSTDGTAQVAANRSIFHYIGEFHDFETSRNLCMDAAKLRVPASVQWILLPDADFTLEGVRQFEEPQYDINIVRIEPVNGGGGVQNALPLLVRKDVFFGQCRYRLWTHEILDCCTAVGAGTTTGYYNAPAFHFVDHSDGSNRPGRLQRDIALLEEWMRRYEETHSRNDPDWRNDLWARALYYLGRAKEDAGQGEDALLFYEAHDAVQPWTNYRFYARYRSALIHLDHYRKRNQTEGWGRVESHFIQAIGAPFGDGTFRREPFYYLTWLHYELGHWVQCRAWAQAALATPAIDYSRMPLFLEPALFAEDWFRGMAQRALSEIKGAHHPVS